MKQLFNILLALVLVGGLSFTVVATYNRIFVQGDYQQEYAIACSPQDASCFSEEICDEVTEECTTEYYALMSRSAATLRKACGNDTSNCLAAQYCLADEFNCSVTYCDPEIEECTNISAEEETVELSP